MKLRGKDYGRAYTLLERCRQVAEDPYAWRLRMVTGLTAVFDAGLSFIADQRLAGDVGQPGWVRPLSMIDHGLPSDSQRRVFWDFLRRGRPEDNPMGMAYVKSDWFDSRRLFVMRRRDAVDDATWYGSVFFREFSSRVDLDDLMLAGYRSRHHPDRFTWVGVQRRIGEAPFKRRDRRLMAVILHLLLVRHAEDFADVSASSFLKLPPRQRQTLLGLLEGDSVKQVADRLGISVNTVNQYIKRMHSRFDVQSRGELLCRARSIAPALAETLQSDTPLDHDRRLDKAVRPPWPEGRSPE